MAAQDAFGAKGLIVIAAMADDRGSVYAIDGDAPAVSLAGDLARITGIDQALTMLGDLPPAPAGAQPSPTLADGEDIPAPDTVATPEVSRSSRACAAAARARS